MENEPEEHPNPDEALSDLQKRVIAKIAEYFASGKEVYYLSQLGGDLGTDLDEIKEHSEGLEQFLTDLDGYYVSSTGEKGNVKFVAKTPDAIPPPSTPQQSRFLPAVWKAFHADLDEGLVRFYNPDTRRYEDVSAGDAGSRTGSHQIDKSYVDEVADAQDDTVAAEIIKKWVMNNKLNLADYVVGPGARRATGQSVLHSLVSVLSQEQLRRVNLPGDIIERLLRS